MIRTADYIVRTLADRGIRHVFMITGGGAMHLNDAFGQEKRIVRIHNHHEQACAIAAEGYFRASGRLPVVNVTSGPGGTNTLTGVIGQWLDSIPAVYLSGQVKQQMTIAACPELGLRQLGDQEINIVDIVKPVTKYAVMLRDPLEVRYHLERALYLATHGRPGPVWLDIPLDVQAARVEEEALRGYDPAEDEVRFDTALIARQVSEVVERLKTALRPVILAGHGIRLAGGIEAFHALVDRLGVPVLVSTNGQDLIASNHPLYAGRPGFKGDRVGNMVIQNCDLLLTIGARLNIRLMGHNTASFARKAYKVMVDIDPAELHKPTLKINLPIHADARYFLEELARQITDIPVPSFKEWQTWCKQCREVLPSIHQDNPLQPGYVDQFQFVETLFDLLEPGSIVISGNGSTFVSVHMAGGVKEGVRVISNQGGSIMGYDLPAVIGAAIACPDKPVILVTGDGSIQMNLQELATIQGYQLPIKIFLLDNGGYLSIRNTQKSFFSGTRVGCDADSGLYLPDIMRIANAYEFSCQEIGENHELDHRLGPILSQPGSVFCRIKVSHSQTMYPRQSSHSLADGKIESIPLDNMYPFVDRQIYDRLAARLPH